MEAWINIPVAAVQSKTTSPGDVELWINICIKRVDFSLGPRHGVGPFMSWSSRETRFCRISSLDTSTPCRSRAGTGWNENLEGGLPGMVLTTNVIPKRIVCHGPKKLNLSTKKPKPRTWENQYVALVSKNVWKWLKKWSPLNYRATLINRGREMKAVHTPPLLPNLKTETLTISENHGFCSHSKRVK